MVQPKKRGSCFAPIFFFLCPFATTHVGMEDKSLLLCSPLEEVEWMIKTNNLHIALQKTSNWKVWKDPWGKSQILWVLVLAAKGYDRKINFLNQIWFKSKLCHLLACVNLAKPFRPPEPQLFICKMGIIALRVKWDNEYKLFSILPSTLASTQ